MSTERTPQTRPEDFAGLIDFYIKAVRFSLSDLRPDATTRNLPNGENDTVESDLVETLGLTAYRLTQEQRHDAGYALGLIVGRAMSLQDKELPPEYEIVARDLADIDDDEEYIDPMEALGDRIIKDISDLDNDKEETAVLAGSTSRFAQTRAGAEIVEKRKAHKLDKAKIKVLPTAEAQLKRHREEARKLKGSF